MTRIQLRRHPLAHPMFNSVARNSDEQPSNPLPVDVRSDNEALYIEADLPGADAESIELSVERGLLSLSAERRSSDVGDQQWLRRERGTGALKRSFRLPEDIDESAIAADYRDGVLSLRIPRSQPVSRRIPVNH